jgi:hypothetical protein
MTAKAVSLGAELAQLARAAQAVVKFLGADEGGGMTEEQQREAAALLCLVVERLRLLRRAVVGVENPERVLATFNEAEAPRAGDDPDILLRPWSSGSPRRSRREVA